MRARAAGGRTRRAAAALLCLALGAAAGCARRYTARGVVIDVAPGAPAVTISHDAVPGLMDAMVMRFEADRRARLADLQKGDRVRFRITVRGDRTTIDRLVLLSAARRDVGLLESPAAPLLTPIGGRVPPVALTDHHGRTVTFDALRGRVVAVNFIYTRCPLPDYCPRMLATFRAVRERFAARLDRDLALVTMTFDPLYDTPERLLEYARRHGADVPGWYFLTGPTGNVARIAAAFGTEYWAEEGLLTHTLQTAVLDRDGVLVATIEGKDFTARQAGDLVDAALAAGR